MFIDFSKIQNFSRRFFCFCFVRFFLFVRFFFVCTQCGASHQNTTTLLRRFSNFFSAVNATSSRCCCSPFAFSKFLSLFFAVSRAVCRLLCTIFECGERSGEPPRRQILGGGGNKCEHRRRRRKLHKLTFTAYT